MEREMRDYELYLTEPFDYEEVGTICDNTAGADIQVGDNFITFYGTSVEVSAIQRKLAWYGVKVTEIKVVK